jgi:hypothetical protein
MREMSLPPKIECEVCKKKFQPIRRSAKCCGDACRQQKRRNKLYAAGLKFDGTPRRSENPRQVQRKAR